MQARIAEDEVGGVLAFALALPAQGDGESRQGFPAQAGVVGATSTFGDKGFPDAAQEGHAQSHLQGGVGAGADGEGAQEGVQASDVAREDDGMANGGDG